MRGVPKTFGRAKELYLHQRFGFLMIGIHALRVPFLTDLFTHKWSDESFICY